MTSETLALVESFLKTLPNLVPAQLDLALLALRSDPRLDAERLAEATRVMRGDLPHEAGLGTWTRAQAAAFLGHVHLRTVDYYCVKGLLTPVSGSGSRKIGVTAESCIRFKSRQEPYRRIRTCEAR